MGHGRKYRTKKSKLGHIGPVSWRDWAIELVLLGELAVRDDGVEVAERLKHSTLKATGLSFDGLMSSWRHIYEADHDRLQSVRAEVPEFFEGCNWAILSLFGLTTPDKQGQIFPPTPAQTKRVLEIMADTWSPQSRLSTRVKALNLLLENGDDSTSAKEFFRTNDPLLASRIRSRWLAVRTLGKQPDADFIVAMLQFGAETPCIGEPYVSPQRRPWPMPVLEEIHNALDALYSSFIDGLGAPLLGDTNDVLVGSLLRIKVLVKRVLTASSEDDGLLAEIVLRSLADTAIQINWLLQRDDLELYERFKSRSYALERDAIESLQAKLVSTGLSKEQAWGVIREDYSGLSSRLGYWPEILDVVYGPWSDTSTSAMTREVGSDFLLVTFQRTSDAAHGSWRSLEKFQLSKCLNPLHVPHHVAATEERRSAGITPVVAALLIQSSTMINVLQKTDTNSSVLSQVEEQHIKLLEWIREHQSDIGVFEWEKIPCDDDPSPGK